MTWYSTIGLGSSANDGTGDTLRVAGGKINSNFAAAQPKLLVGSFTLTTGATSSTITITGLLPTSIIVYSPAPGVNSAYAAAMYGDLQPTSQTADTLVLEHPSTTQTCKFNYIASV